MKRRFFSAEGQTWGVDVVTPMGLDWKTAQGRIWRSETSQKTNC